MDIEFIGASHGDAPIPRNLMQLHTHSFTEFWGGTPRGDLGADGRFGDSPLDD
jgi:hypothetical protein